MNKIQDLLQEAILFRFSTDWKYFSRDECIFTFAGVDLDEIDRIALGEILDANIITLAEAEKIGGFCKVRGGRVIWPWETSNEKHKSK